MARLCYGFLIVFLLKPMLGECKEYDEETDHKEVLGDEYEQIFHNIPTLFEYLLEMLEDSPEILEKNDVMFFQEVPQEFCEGEVKREAIREDKCDDNLDRDNFKALKRNINPYYLANTGHANNGNDRAFLVDLPITTDLPVTIDTEMTTGIFEDTTNINGKIKPRDTRRNRKAERNVNSKINKGNYIKVETKKMKHKRNVVNVGDSFLKPIDWTQFYLSPEEVEEQAIKTEQAIEDHNRKDR